MLKILISNDDGIHAPGIEVLNDTLKDIYETWVVAPDTERSTTGHSLHLNSPLRLNLISERVYSCSGFPADCVLMGLGHLLKNNKPEVVVSGINRGANLAQDLYYSGTMAAAREAAFHGYPSIAVSLSCNYFSQAEEMKFYATAAQALQTLLKYKIYETIPKFSMLNINVPNLPWKELKGFSMTRLGFRNYSEKIEHRVDSRGRDYFWIGGNHTGDADFEGASDCEKVKEGFVSVTALDLLNRGIDFSNVVNIMEDINNEVRFH